MSMRYVFWLFLSISTGFAASSMPVIKDARLKMSLFAAEPEIVTPTGIAVDAEGRIFVIESHTHFPKPDYPGPKSDQIKVFSRTKDHTNGASTIFADGFRAAMNLAFGPGGQLYLVHRNGVVILHDRDDDGKCEGQTTVVEMVTKGDYPHNGLGGIAFSHDGWLYLGMGENLGASYTVKARDGSSHAGGGEGGNVFRCRPDGSSLELVATGFWNAFALEFNRNGYLFCVDNDPDGRPPCRLIDVVMGGDYGYKFRYGRSGLHPFIAWNGELPGTLPMAAGSGEAPSGILDCSRTALGSDYVDALLVTSWGDHTLEIYRPQPFGASVRAEREVLVQGADTFRPVAAAAAPDGSIYVTDWVDRDYSVHRKGRIWKITNGLFRSITRQGLAGAGERFRMDKVLKSSFRRELFEALKDDDPFIRSAAVYSLTKTASQDDLIRGLNDDSAKVRLGCVLALRRMDVSLSSEQLSRLVSDRDEDVRLITLVWIGEKKAKSVDIERAVAHKGVSAALFRTYLATKEVLAAGSTNLQVFAFKPRHDAAIARQWLQSPALGLRLQGLRVLAELNTAPDELFRIALNKKDEPQLRAEAVAALAGQSDLERLLPLLGDPDPSIQLEVVRSVRPVASEPRVRAALERRLNSAVSDRVRRQIEFTLNKQPADGKTHPLGDPQSGQRLFFNVSLGCARCHRIEDFGGHIGPDLSIISRASDRKKLLESILQPSKEIAPQFVQHTVETKDGETWSGLLTSKGADGSLTLTTSEGRAVVMPATRIKSHVTSNVSLMPEGLHQSMSPDDLQDLLAFLSTRK